MNAGNVRRLKYFIHEIALECPGCHAPFAIPHARTSSASAMKDFQTTRGHAGRENIKSIHKRNSILLGTIDGNGWIRFLNTAWEDVPGCRAKVAKVQPLRELIPLDRSAADRLVDRLLDPNSHEPVEMELNSANGARRRYLWHRRFDPQEEKMYIAGVEVVEPESGT